MTYEILSVRQTEPISPIFFTLVKYDLDGVEKTIEVAQQDPKTSAEIEQNIIDRGNYEIYLVEAAARQAALIPSIDLNTPKAV